jgi:hypothetical protein
MELRQRVRVWSIGHNGVQNIRRQYVSSSLSFSVTFCPHYFGTVLPVRMNVQVSMKGDIYY